MKVNEIAPGWLLDDDYDESNELDECSLCEFADLIPCDDPLTWCPTGYKAPCIRKEEHEYDIQAENLKNSGSAAE